METTFYICLGMRTTSGFETFAKYDLGNNRKFANSVFEKLKGTSNASEESPLHLELTETKDNLPLNIRMIACTLDQLTENCKVITMELFKFLNMKEI